MDEKKAELKSKKKAEFEEMILEALSKAADERRDKGIEMLNSTRDNTVNDFVSKRKKGGDELVYLATQNGLFSTSRECMEIHSTLSTV